VGGRFADVRPEVKGENHRPLEGIPYDGWNEESSRSLVDDALPCSHRTTRNPVDPTRSVWTWEALRSTAIRAFVHHLRHAACVPCPMGFSSVQTGIDETVVTPTTVLSSSTTLGTEGGRSPLRPRFPRFVFPTIGHVLPIDRTTRPINRPDRPHQRNFVLPTRSVTALSHPLR